MDEYKWNNIVASAALIFMFIFIPALAVYTELIAPPSWHRVCGEPGVPQEQCLHYVLKCEVGPWYKGTKVCKTQQ